MKSLVSRKLRMIAVQKVYSSYLHFFPITHYILCINNNKKNYPIVILIIGKKTFIICPKPDCKLELHILSHLRVMEKIHKNSSVKNMLI